MLAKGNAMTMRMPQGKKFFFRLDDYAHVLQEHLLPAAQWWARNATTMSSADPWKSHFAMVPIVALISPDAISLLHWLDAAHRATGATSGSIYESCLVELRLKPYPWQQHEFKEAHERVSFVTLYRQQMQEILNEVRNDSAIATPGLFRLDG